MPTFDRPIRRVGASLLLALTVLLVALAGTAPTATAAPSLPPPGDDGPWEPPEPPEPEPDPEPDPDPWPPDPPEEEPPPPPYPQCDDAAGWNRPSGAVPPGYVYSPTVFDGTVAMPQPDDTFVADAPGHTPWVGKLRTRTANGREEFLVCAHVGTNTPSDALTPFPLPGPGGHAATIAPRVVVIDAAGNKTNYDLGAAGVESSLSHYAGSTDVHEGFVQMWVPFTPSLREPGFTVRVEIRGTSALPSGGVPQVMGADEAYVHVGPAPVHRSTRVTQAAGVALDDGVIGERPDDPGADDLSSLVATDAMLAIDQAIQAQAPASIPSDWDWDPGLATLATEAGGTLDSISATVNDFAVDVENFNATEGRVAVTVGGSAWLHMTLYPNSVGLVSIVDGTCRINSSVDYSAKIVFTINLSDDLARPEIDFGFIDASATVTSVNATGTMYAFPYVPLSCDRMEDDVEGGTQEQLNEKLRALEQPAVVDRLSVVASEALKPADLGEGPLSTVDVSIGNGLGFKLLSPRYVPTRPNGGIGGEVFTSADGINLAAGFLVYDEGGQRFQFSYVPSETYSVVNELTRRSRPGGGSFDVGAVVSGATVNQLSRALTAGKPVSIVAPPPCCVHQLIGPNTTMDVGLLDIFTKVDVNGDGTPDVDVVTQPATPPLYLPKAPTGWPAPGNIDLLVPSLRIHVPGVISMASDIRVGLDATLAGNHLEPSIQSSAVDARFLQLGPGLNQVGDPTADPNSLAAIAAREIGDAVPGRVAEMLRPITLPDMRFGSTNTQVHLENLTVGTAGGGHLGAYVDVVAGPPPPTPPTLSTTWTADGPGGSPTALTTSVMPRGLPVSGAFNVRWTFTDLNGGAVVYQSPEAGEAGALTKTVPATGLVPTVDPCTGDQTVAVAISSAVTRAGVTKTETGSGAFIWPGQAPTNPPQWCFEPEPEPEPDPEEDPITICDRMPWKCPDEP